MSRLTGFADLNGLTVGVWGIGVEGEATLRRLSTVSCAIVLVDDLADTDRGTLATANGGLERLAECDVVLKSPGIPRRRADVLSLEERGVIVTSALNLWLAETDPHDVIAVIGTKGKSTTTALITFFLTTLGHEAHSAGNIGSPPYDPSFPVGLTVLEVSSFQSVDLESAPSIIVVTSLGEDHLDWHGSVEQYHEDKLAITRAAGAHVTLVAEDPALRARSASLGGEVIFVEPCDDDLVDALGLLGRHNARNVAVAIAATASALDLSTELVEQKIRRMASSFSPLEGRLTPVRTIAGIRFVDDGLATSPLPTIAALEVFAHEPVALIVGGFDRGVDYTPLARALGQRDRPTTLIAMPDVGRRIVTAVSEHTSLAWILVETMAEAVHAAREALPDGGVVLLSPAASSFGRYNDWRERSAEFAQVVGDLRG